MVPPIQEYQQETCQHGPDLSSVHAESRRGICTGRASLSDQYGQRDLDGQLIYLRSCLEPLWEAVSDSVRILLTQESAITEGKLVPQEPIYEILILLTWKLSLLGLTHSLSC